jgi:hypothetical protein
MSVRQDTKLPIRQWASTHSLFILAVDTRSLDEFVFELADTFRVRFGGQVDGECVDHVECFIRTSITMPSNKVTERNRWE